MRYKLDSNGFIQYVLFGCYSGNCAEYTGAVPSGYSSLTDWADNACVNAYYLDENGDLMLDAQRQSYLQTLWEQQAIDYAPVLHRDLFATNEVIEAQYRKRTVSGTVIEVKNARNIAPMVTITGLTGDSLTVFSQTKNMLRNDAANQEINGLTFTRGDDGGITISGTATADVEYTISGGEEEPLFALLQGRDYCLFVGAYTCELLYFDGETTEQVYTGTGGVINLSESKRVTEVKLKFASGTTVDDTIYPTLALGTSTISYEECQTKVYSMELPEYEEGAFIIIGEGLAVLYSGSKTYVVGRSNMGLLNGYNMIYTSQGNDLEITYTTNVLMVDDMAFLQGTSTTSGKFKIMDDGSISASGGVFNGEVTCTKLKVMSGASVSGLSSGVSASQVTVITQDSIKTGELKLGGNIYRIVDTVINETDDYLLLGINLNGNLQVGSPSSKANYENMNVYAPKAINFMPDGATDATASVLRLDDDAVEIRRELICQKAYDETCTYAPNLYVGSTGHIRRTTETSSREIKDDIVPLQGSGLQAEKLYDAEVVQFKYKTDVLPETDARYRMDLPGFIVEDLEEVYPIAVDKDENGKPFAWNSRYLIPPMLKLLQDQKKEIDSLKASIEEIKNGGAV